MVTTASPLVLGAMDEVALVEGDRVIARGSHTALMTDARYCAVVAREDT